MTTSLAKRTPHTEAIEAAGPQTAPVRGSLSARMSFRDMVEMGNDLVRTGFLPKAITNGAQAAAIMMAGDEMGMAPMRALRSLRMVLGNVTEMADSQLSRFKAQGGRAIFKRHDAKGATIWLRHPNGDEHEETFDESDARAAGLLGGMYSKWPKAMYRSRAITAGLKGVGWEDASSNYDPSELEDVEVPKHATSLPRVVQQVAPATVVEHDETDPLAALTEACAECATLGDLRTKAHPILKRTIGRHPDAKEAATALYRGRKEAIEAADAAAASDPDTGEVAPAAEPMREMGDDS